VMLADMWKKNRAGGPPLPSASCCVVVHAAGRRTIDRDQVHSRNSPLTRVTGGERWRKVRIGITTDPPNAFGSMLGLDVTLSVQ